MLAAARRLRILPATTSTNRANGSVTAMTDCCGWLGQDNQQAKELLAERARVLGEAVALLRDVLNPDELVVGGQAFTEYPEGDGAGRRGFRRTLGVAAARYPRHRVRQPGPGGRGRDCVAGWAVCRSARARCAEPARWTLGCRTSNRTSLRRNPPSIPARLGRPGPSCKDESVRHDDVFRLNDPRRIAVLAVHTSPLAQPGTGDAGGMNVYVLQTALHMARRGIEVEIFTRATSSADPPVVQVAPGVLVRNVVAGPFEGLDKYDLPTQLCAFTAGVLRAEANHEPGHYDIVHSHYWLSGQVGWLARDRWAVPLVHTAHTLAAVKNAALADGDAPEPPLRAVGEQQVVDEADRLIVNTEDEAQTIDFDPSCRSGPDRRGASRCRPADVFTPGRPAGGPRRARPADDEPMVAFVGRIQPLKAPDVLLRAAAASCRGCA